MSRKLPKGCDAKNLERLTELHLRRYGGRLAAARTGASGYREAELVDLVTLWEGVRAKEYDWDRLSFDQCNEIRDALMDEES